MLKKVFNELHALAWTLGGSGVVLITLSGETRKWGTWITIVSFAIHMLGIVLKKEETNE